MVEKAGPRARRRRKDARGMEQGLQLFRSIRQGRRTGFPHGLDLAVAPGDADGGDAVDLGPQNVKGGVPHHHHLAGVADLGEKIGDDVLLGLPACVQGGPADALEVTGQLEMLQHLLGGDLGLGGGHEKTVSRTLQPVQQAGNAGVGGVFKFSNGDIPGPETGNGLVQGRRGNPEAGKALPQGRAHKDPELIAVRHLDAKMGQGQLGAVDDPGTGVGQGSV